MNEKQAFYFLAIKEILELFAEQELGARCEINIPAVLAYTSSLKFGVDSIEYNTKEEIYQLVTDDIIAGYPIWQLLNIPEWTRNMLEKELANKVIERRKYLEKTYKCYTCKWFDEFNGSIGTILDCKRPIEKKSRYHGFKPLRREEFKVKKSCKYYERKEDTDE